MHIPNADVVTETVTVYSTDVERRSAIGVKLAYDTEIDHAEQVIRAALDEVDEVTRLGSIRAESLDSCVALSVRVWHESSIDAANQTTDAVIRALHRAFRDAGIQGAPSVEIRLIDPLLPTATLLGLPDAATPLHDR